MEGDRDASSWLYPMARPGSLFRKTVETAAYPSLGMERHCGWVASSLGGWWGRTGCDARWSAKLWVYAQVHVPVDRNVNKGLLDEPANPNDVANAMSSGARRDIRSRMALAAWADPHFQTEEWGPTQLIADPS